MRISTTSHEAKKERITAFSGRKTKDIVKEEKRRAF